MAVRVRDFSRAPTLLMRTDEWAIQREAVDFDDPGRPVLPANGDVMVDSVAGHKRELDGVAVAAGGLTGVVVDNTRLDPALVGDQPGVDGRHASSRPVL